MVYIEEYSSKILV